MFLTEYYMENVDRLLFTAKTSAPRAHYLLDWWLYAGLTGLLLAFYRVTSCRGGPPRHEGCPAKAAQRLLAEVEELLIEELESVRESYRLREERKRPFFVRFLLFKWRFNLLFFREELTMLDTAWQGDGSDPVQRLLTRVTEALSAANQCLQTPDAEDHTFEAFRRIMATLAGHLRKAVSEVRSNRVRMERAADHVGKDEAAAAGYPCHFRPALISYRIYEEQAADPVGQDEAARAAELPSRQLETLLIAMKSALRTGDGAVQGLVDPHGEPPSSNSVSEGHRGATSSQGGDTTGQGGDGAGQRGHARGQGGDTAREGDTSEAVERLLAALEELLSEALESVRTPYRLREEREGSLFMRISRIYSYEWRKPFDIFPEELTMWDPAGQGNGSDTVQRLLTRVTEALTAAEQCLQSPDAQDHTFEASRRILAEALQLASTAQGSASTLCGVSLEHGALCQPARRLLATLAGVLRKAASVVRSHRVKMERAADPVGKDMKVWSRYFYYCLPIDFSYLKRQGQGGGTSSQRDASLALQSLLRDLSQLGIEGQMLYGIFIPQQTVFRRYYPNLRERADPLGQGETSQASRPPLTQLAELEGRAQDTVLTFRKLAVDQKRLPAAARRLFKGLAELLHVTASLETSYRVNKGRGDESVTGQLPLLAGPDEEKQKNPEPTSCCDHGWTGFPKSVWKGQTKFPLLAAVSLVVIAGLVACIVVLLSNQSTEQQIELKGVQSSAAETGKTGQVLPPCGHGWIWYRGKCNFFSEAKGTWAEAKDSCSALDSSLATIDTQKELNFMLRYKGDDNHWIGLRRDDKSQLWTWVNGTKFNNWFTVNDTSECAYLSYGQVKSLECDITNKWICTKVTINSV